MTSKKLPNEIIRLAGKLSLPVAMLQQHIVAMGKTRSGKSSAVRLFVEALLDHGQHVVVVDPKGDWFGLKLARDGKSPGYPVVAFGDFKEPKATDVPIKADAAAEVAELLVSGGRSAVIGLRGWGVQDLGRFWSRFAETTFAKIKYPLWLVVDEVHNFAPKEGQLKGAMPDAVHWSKRLAAEGLGMGVRLLVASQRPQKVHNDVLTSCETLLAMRVLHHADRQAIKVWLDGAGDKEKSAEILDTLAGLQRGEGWVWSPESDFGPKRLQFPMFETYDSFAEPQPGQRRNLKGWANVNLDDVKTKLAQVVADKEANDPKKLQLQVAAQAKEIASLKAVIVRKDVELAAAAARPAAVKEKRVEIKVLPAVERARLEKVVREADRGLRDRQESLRRSLESCVDTIGKPIAALAKLLAGLGDPTAGVDLRPTVTRPVNHFPQAGKKSITDKVIKTRAAATTTADGLQISKTQQRILDALAWYESIGKPTPTLTQLGAVALLDTTGGHFSNVVGPLSSGGLVSRGEGVISLTDAGRALANMPEQVATLGEYHEVLRKRIRKMKSANGKTIEILNVIIAAGGAAITSEEIGQAVGIDHTGGHFSNCIGPLGTAGVVTRKDGVVTPTDVLFPKGMER